MSSRRSIGLPVVLGIVMIPLLLVLLAGWILLSVMGALADSRWAGLYWAVLTVGAILLLIVLVGVVMYLALSIKAINLTRRQSNFIDSVTHELKSPIASLKLYLQTLHRRQVSPEQQESFYQYMLDDVERLDCLINHILEAARLERDETERAADQEHVELDQLLRQCAETVCLRYRLPTDIVRLDLQPAQVSAPRVDLEMIFRNLIDNAVKYAAAEPRIEVTLKSNDAGRLVARIADNGCGIPRRQRRRIFGRFVRLGMELQRKQPGTGLGLYIVRTLVGRLGGRIRVHDRPGGPGTVFEVTLPASRRGPEAAAGTILAQPTGSGTEQKVEVG